MQVSIKYGSKVSDFISRRLSGNIKRQWNELSIVFNNSNPLCANILLNLTTLNPKGDKSLTDSILIQPSNLISKP